MTRDLFDGNQFMASIAYDDGLAVELLDAFLEDAPRRVRELDAALEAGELPTAAKLAHSLKGMCGVVRSEVLGGLALEMEYAGRDGRLDAAREKFARFTDILDRTIPLMVAFKRGR